MTNIVHWDPFREMQHMRRNVDRMFDEWFRRPLATMWEGEDAVPMDVYETDDLLVIKAALPGVKPDEVALSVSGDTLTIKGETRSEEEKKQGSYYRKEMRYGSFARSLVLPTTVDHDKAEATFENGVLTISIPKSAEVKPKSIPVKNIATNK